MLKAIRSAYAGGFAFMAGMPILFLLPVLAEFIQHVVEHSVGMFDSLAAMKEAEDDPARMTTGQGKVLVLALMHYVVVRYLGSGGDRGLAMRIDRGSARSYGPVLLFGLAMQLGFFAGGDLMRAAGIPEGSLTLVGSILFLALFLLDLLLLPWKAAGALEDRRIGFGGSIAMTARRFPAVLAIFIAAVLPLMAAHYALNFLAVGKADALTWTILAADSLLVGLLTAVMSAANLSVYRYVLERRALDPAGAPAAAAA